MPCQRLAKLKAHLHVPFRLPVSLVGLQALWQAEFEKRNIRPPVFPLIGLVFEMQPIRLIN